MSRVRFRVSVPLALAIGGMVALPSGAGAQTAGPPTLSGPGVVHYHPTEVLINRTYQVYQGSQLPGGGCTFHGSATVMPGQPQVTQVELAYDPTRCRSVLESGNLVAGSTGQSGARSASGAHQATNGPVSAQTAGNADNYAYLHSWFHDPPGIHVADATNYVYWYPNGSCAWPPGTTATVGYKYQWFTATGWYLAGSNWTYGFSCSGIYSQSYAHMQNRAFCAAISPILYFFPTDVYFNNNYVDGLANGGYSVAWTWSKSGPCSPLLSYQNQYA